MYSTFIILIAQIVRDMLVGSHEKIMFDELPNVDRLIGLLNDILLVRSLNMIDLESVLHDKLIHIYRDPNLLIFITRHDLRRTNKKSSIKK